MDPVGVSDAELRGFAPAPRRRLWRDTILPRTVLPLFWLAWVCLLPAWLWGVSARRRRAGQAPMVAVESGLIGWTQVFFEELLGSVQDYVGPEHVAQQVIDRELPYLPQYRANQSRDNPTHVVLDVRTPGQAWGPTLREGFAVSWHLLATGRTPVVILTDAFYRRQRWHAACLTAFYGVVLTFAPTSVLAPLFPHRRIIGPLPMPISQERLEWLEEVAAVSERSGGSVQFIGHVYPPRSDFLEAVGRRLADMGITLSVNGDKWGTSNEAYWRTLASADVVVTTCMQGPDRPIVDWNWEPQLVLRYNEALAAGAALVASKVEGSDRWFRAGTDFLEFVSVDEAVAAIESLVRDPARRAAITQQGHRTSADLTRSHSFWEAADAVLQGHRMRPVG